MSLILNGTDGLSDVDGTAATPAIRGTDTNTGIFFPAADTIAFSEGGVESMRLTSTGNLGIGTSNPAQKFVVSDGGVDFVTSAGGGTQFVGTITNNPMAFVVSSAERMRIDSAGSLNINQTSSNGATLNITGFNVTEGTAEFTCPAKGINKSHIHFGSNGDWYIRPASNSGKVYVLNYQAESDERLKKDITPITYGLSEIAQLQPRQFKWKNGDDSEVNGFIAQEVEAIIPALVSEGQWKSVDYQGITAILVKAIQELKETVDAQAARIAALESAKV